MFEHIPMKTYRRVIPRTPTNRSEFPDFPVTFPQDATDAMDCDFVLDGCQKFVPLLPVSDFMRNHCLYLQVFMYLESKEKYYTRRTNYNSYLLLYTYDGCGILEYKNKTYTLSPETCILIDCRKPHYYHTRGASWTHLDIHFDGITAEHFYSIWEKQEDLSFTVSTRIYQPMIEHLIYDYVNYSSERELLVSNHLNSILLFALKERNKQKKTVEIPEHIRNSVMYLEENFKEPVSLDELARVAELSKYHFSREFKKYIGESPKDYLIRIRIDNAKFLLETSNIPCYKIGLLSGISNYDNFTRLFEKRCQMTPGEYREYSREIQN